jgi:predicted amidophosphoribosyltransferase
VGLTAAQRQANVQAAFQAQPALVAGRNVLLVDDVCTTGATLVAGAEALTTAGAVSVWGFTLGRAR